MSDEKTSVNSQEQSGITEKPSAAVEIPSRLQSKKETAAVNLGIAASEVETMPFDLSQLETEGIFLNVDCRGFSTLERQIEWKSLGVELPAQGAVRLSPPRAGLLQDFWATSDFRKRPKVIRWWLMIWIWITGSVEIS